MTTTRREFKLIPIEGLIAGYGLPSNSLNVTKSKYKGIVFCGPMSSGKTTYAKIFAPAIPNSKQIALSAPLKDICIRGYGMDPDPNKKDRTLLQKVGDALRTVDENVFVNFLVHDAKGSFVVNDDGRRNNEFREFSNAGFLLVRLLVDPEERLKRVKTLYPHVTEKEMSHETETESDGPYAMSMYHLVLHNNREDQIENNIVKIIDALNH